MILLANTFDGQLDISAPEQLGEPNWIASTPFRRTMVSGQILRVPDEYYAFPNIRNAVGLGLLQIVAFDSSPWSLVVNAELSAISGAGVVGIKYILLDIHGGEDTEEIRDISGTPYLIFRHGRLGRTRWTLTVPDDFRAGTAIQVQVFWSNGGAGAGAVKWGMEYKSIAPGASVSPGPTTVTFVQAAPASGILTTTGSSLSIPSGSVSANDLLSLAAERQGADGADTLAGPARVHLVRLAYTGLRFSNA